MYLVQDRSGLAEALAVTLVEAKKSIHECEICGNYTASDGPCTICSDTRRSRAQICVVERVPDLLAIEQTGYFKGVYHVLHGVISPLNGKGPDDIRLKELLSRLEGGEVEELIVATNPTVDGDGTALYLQKVVNDPEIRVTRLASGIPTGGNLEYIDANTISRAMEGRRDL